MANRLKRRKFHAPGILKMAQNLSSAQAGMCIQINTLPVFITVEHNSIQFALPPIM